MLDMINVTPGPNMHHGLIEAWMTWPWTTTSPEKLQQAQKRLQNIFSNTELRWNESETIRRIIFPILTEILGYPGEDLTESPKEIKKFGESRLHPDLYFPEMCVIEAKRVKVPLLRYSADASKFTNPLDQGITYLDNYDAKSCIITNGWDWYFILKTLNWDQFNGGNIINYFGVRFRLDEAASSIDTTRLSQFISMVNYTCMSGASNDLAYITHSSLYILPRKLYSVQSNLYFADFSNGPVKGQGSGFNWTPPPA